MTHIAVKRLLGVGLLLVSALASADPRMVDGAIARQVDGDTVWLQPEEGWGETDILKIRMIGIDAPETHLVTSEGPKGQQPWGDMATEKLKRLLPLEAKVSIDDQGKDKFGRTLGRVFRNNSDVDLKMVQSGWAIPYIICSGPRCNTNFFDDERVDEYAAACETAMKKGLGIFDPENPLKEMPFEFRVRMQNREFDKYVGDYRTKKLYAPDQYKKVPLCQRIFFITLKEAELAGYSVKHAFEPLDGFFEELL